MLKKMLHSLSDDVIVVQPQSMVLEDVRNDKKKVTASAVADAIIYNCSKEMPKRSAEAKGQQLKRILEAVNADSKRVAVVIDEAHLLWKQTLKALKRMRDMGNGFEPLLGVVLIGQPELADLLNERFNPDIREAALRCERAYLEPLNAEEIQEYMSLKFSRLSQRIDCAFDADAFSAMVDKLQVKRNDQLHVIAHPLAINNLAVRCMNLAATDDYSGIYDVVNAEIVGAT
jgi:type II secretory pathway predicted ATPase ExeA